MAVSVALAGPTTSPNGFAAQVSTPDPLFVKTERAAPCAAGNAREYADPPAVAVTVTAVVVLDIKILGTVALVHVNAATPVTSFVSEITTLEV